MVSLVTTGLWMMVAYLQTDKKRYLILAAFFASWGFFSKITGMITLLPMLYAIVSILQARKKLTVPNATRIILPGVLAIGLVAAYYLWARYLSLHYPPYHFAGADNWLWDDGLQNWLQQRYFLPNTAYIFRYWTLGLPFICIFIAGIFTSFVYIKNKKQTGQITAFKAPYFFHFWLVGCLVFYSIGAKELTGNFWNFHIWDPMIATFCGSAIVGAWAFLKKQKTLTLAAGVLLLAWIGISNRRVLANTFTDQYYISDYRMGVRLNTLRRPDDLVVVLAREVGNPIAIFYSKGRGWVFPPAGNYSWDQLPASDSACIAILEDLRKQGASWFGIHHDQYRAIQQSYPEFAKYLLSRYRLHTQEADFAIFKL